MTIQLTKQEFERVLPVATEPTGQVFEACADALDDAERQLSAIFGTGLLSHLDTSAPEGARQLLLRTLCLMAFAGTLPQLDLTMTPDGFAVASTDKIAPASKERVQRLADTLDIQWREAADLLAGWIYADPEAFAIWTQEGDPSRLIRHIFWRRADLCAIFGTDPRTLHDTWEHFPRLYALDPYISFYISLAYMQELHSKTLCRKLTDADRRILPLLLRAYSALLRGVQPAAALRPLLTEMKSRPADYPAYTSSPEHQLSDFDRYENKKEDTSYFFGM